MFGVINSGMMAAALALANTAPPPNSPQQADATEIVVSGISDMDHEIREFVGALSVTPGARQLSRFEKRPVCPLAIGIPESQKEAVASRMRQVAAAAGIVVGGKACKPNVVVAVTQDKKAFIDALRRRHPYFFEQLSPRQHRRLLREPGPAAAWHVHGPLVTSDGREMPSVSGENGADFQVNFTINPGSRIIVPTHPQFAAAMVVVERSALDGLTTTQLADYASMRAFAQVDTARLAGSAAPTILKVLEVPMGGAVPITMTRWDFGMLRSLYTSPTNLYAAAQRSAIRRRLSRELKQPETRGD
jgi:hypothetical protein